MKLALLVLLALPAATAGIPSKGFPPPPLVNGSVGFTALDKNFYAVSGTDVFTVEQGKLVRRDASGTLTMKAWTEPNLYAAQPIPIGQNVYLQQGGKLHAFDRQTLKVRWSKSISGELLNVREFPLLRQNGSFSRLNPASGAAVWTIGRTNAEYAPTDATVAGGILLVHQSPSEGFLGEVYAAHDPQTGRRLWQASLRRGRLLKVAGAKAYFDLRDWDNRLDAGGLFRLAELDLKTGIGRMLPHTLRGLEGWSVDIGSPLLDDQGTLWLVMRAPHGGGTRLVRADASGPKLWPLPAGWVPQSDGGEVKLFEYGEKVVVATPGGVAVLRGEKLQTIPLPLGAGLPTFTPLGRWLGLTTGWGTVVLDEFGQVKYQAQKAGLPALSGPYLLMPIEGRLTLFPASKP